MPLIKAEPSLKNMFWKPNFELCAKYLFFPGYLLPFSLPEENAVIIYIKNYQQNEKEANQYTFTIHISFMVNNNYVRKVKGDIFLIDRTFLIKISEKQINNLASTFKLDGRGRIQSEYQYCQLLRVFYDEVQNAITHVPLALLFTSAEDMTNFYFNLNYDWPLDEQEDAGNTLGPLTTSYSPKQKTKERLAKLSEGRGFFKQAYESFPNYGFSSVSSRKRKQPEESELEEEEESPTKKQKCEGSNFCP